MSITVVQANIVAADVDAVVNAANESLRGGGGVDGAIHRPAGPGLLAECTRYPGLPTGEAVVTGGYRLPARHVVHTVGPIWRGGSAGEAELLERAYESVFRAAAAQGEIRTIAFPAISTGAYGYPKPEAARIAVQVMRRHESAFEAIVVCLMDAENVALYEAALRATEA